MKCGGHLVPVNTPWFFSLDVLCTLSGWVPWKLLAFEGLAKSFTTG